MTQNTQINFAELYKTLDELKELVSLHPEAVRFTTALSTAKLFIATAAPSIKVIEVPVHKENRGRKKKYEGAPNNWANSYYVLRRLLLQMHIEWKSEINLRTHIFYNIADECVITKIRVKTSQPWVIVKDPMHIDIYLKALQNIRNKLKNASLKIG